MAVAVPVTLLRSGSQSILAHETLVAEAVEVVMLLLNTWHSTEAVSPSVMEKEEWTRLMVGSAGE